MGIGLAVVVILNVEVAGPLLRLTEGGVKENPDALGRPLTLNETFVLDTGTGATLTTYVAVSPAAGMLRLLGLMSTVKSETLMGTKTELLEATGSLLLAEETLTLPPL
jgi:hypothetical protein